jgi:hypothetical protein
LIFSLQKVLRVASRSISGTISFGRLDAKTTLETERGRVLEKIIKEQVRGGEPGQK